MASLSGFPELHSAFPPKVVQLSLFIDVETEEKERGEVTSSRLPKKERLDLNLALSDPFLGSVPLGVKWEV